jgi:hypothetical protein
MQTMLKPFTINLELPDAPTGHGVRELMVHLDAAESAALNRILAALVSADPPIKLNDGGRIHSHEHVFRLFLDQAPLPAVSSAENDGNASNSST